MHIWLLIFCVCVTMAELTSCDRYCMVCKNLYYLSLYGRSFLTTGLEHKIYIARCEKWHERSLLILTMDSIGHSLTWSLFFSLPHCILSWSTHRPFSFKRDFWLIAFSCDVSLEFLFVCSTAYWINHLINP